MEEKKVRDNRRKLIELQKCRNKELRNEIALDNEDLVWYITNRYTSSTATKDDMYQAGMVGLCTAIDKFDPSLGTQLSTYAVPYIQNEIRALVDNPDYIDDHPGFEPEDEYQENPFREKLEKLYASILTSEERTVLDTILRTNDEPALSVNDISKLLGIPGRRIRELYASGVMKLNQPWVCWYISLLKKHI